MAKRPRRQEHPIHLYILELLLWLGVIGALVAVTVLAYYLMTLVP